MSLLKRTRKLIAHTFTCTHINSVFLYIEAMYGWVTKVCELGKFLDERTRIQGDIETFNKQ